MSPTHAFWQSRFDTLNALRMQPVRWRNELLRREILSLMGKSTTAVGEVRILASEPVWEAATALVRAVQDGAKVTLDALSKAAGTPPALRFLRPEPLPAANAPQVDQAMERLGQVGTEFVRAVKAEMEIAKVPERLRSVP